MRVLLEKRFLAILVLLGLTVSIVFFSLLFFYWRSDSVNWNSISCMIYVQTSLVVFGIIWFLLLPKKWFLWLRSKRFIRQCASIVDYAIPILVIVFVLKFCNLFLYDHHDINKSVHILVNPGGFFAVIMGLLTLVGIYIALLQVADLKYKPITSYPQLIDRLTELMKDTMKDKEFEIKFVSYFLLLGYWQVGGKSYLMKQFQKTLEETIKNNQLNIVCLKSEEYVKVLIDMAKNTQEETLNNHLKAITDYMIKCEMILSAISDESGKRLGLSELLPQYYFFVNEKRAIIVSPVGLPKVIDGRIEKKGGTISKAVNIFVTAFNNLSKEEKEQFKKDENSNLLEDEKKEFVTSVSSDLNKAVSTADNNGNKKNNKNKNKMFTKVSTLGFETTDQSIISVLLKEFDKLKKL